MLDEAGIHLEKTNLSKTPPVETQACTTLPWTQPVGVVPAVHLDAQSSESNHASARATCAADGPGHPGSCL